MYTVDSVLHTEGIGIFAILDYKSAGVTIQMGKSSHVYHSSL